MNTACMKEQYCCCVSANLSLILVQPLFGVVLCSQVGDEVQGGQASLPSWWHKNEHRLGWRVRAYCCGQSKTVELVLILHRVKEYYQTNAAWKASSISRAHVLKCKNSVYKLHLGRWACSCWPCGGSSAVLENRGCELQAGPGAQTDGS